MFKPTLHAAAAASLLAGAFVTAGPASANPVALNTPDFDRWNYPFNFTPGVRNAASTFGAFVPGSFDERDAQFVLGFEVGSSLPALTHPSQSYQVNSVSVTATHLGGAFDYDPTYDGFASYPGGGGTDLDAGRPILLTGVDTRVPVIGLSTSASPFVPSPPFFKEDSAFGFGDPTAENVRNVFAAAFDGSNNLVDVSNNVSDGFDFTPFAVGTTTGVNPGAPVVAGVTGVSAGSTFTFDIDLADPNILGYVEDGLLAGELFFAISSLHPASQSGGTQGPAFYTRDSTDLAAIAPTLTYDVTVVPEPASMALAAAALGLATMRRRRVV